MVLSSTRAPTRVDLAGGTIDLWPIHQLIPQKSTVNVGVGLWAQCEIRASSAFRIFSQDQGIDVTGDFQSIVHGPARVPLLSDLIGAFWKSKDPAIELQTSAQSPAGAGLGGSSCLAVAIVRALLDARKKLELADGEWDEESAIETIRDIETRIINAPAGIQDYWGGARGGLNVITYPPGRPRIKTYRTGSLLDKIEDSLLLIYSGKSRASAMNNLEIFNRFLSADREVVKHLEQIGHLAEVCAAAVERSDFDGVLQASLREWQVRKELWPGIATVETEAIDRAALQAGAYFSRVCGAGGGGVVAVLAPAEKLSKIGQTCATIPGARVLSFERARDGLAVKL